MFNIKTEKYKIEYCPERVELTIVFGNSRWEWKDTAFVRLNDGTEIPFTSATCESSEYVTGVADGVRAVYSEFTDKDGTKYNFSVHTFLAYDISSDRLRCEMWIENEPEDGLAAVSWPCAFKFDAEENRGYTVLPRMQGTLIPAKLNDTINGGSYEGMILERDAYMPIWGQVRDDSGYLAIVDTPYDANYGFIHPAGGDTTIYPIFISSMGKMNYKRAMLYVFRENYDYNGIAKDYRHYVKEHGNLVTLKEKIVKNPNVAKFIGTPLLHIMITDNVRETSTGFNHEDDSRNHFLVTFAEREKQIRKLHEKGLKKAFLHFDGWCVYGYDDGHPDPFPINEKAGGVTAMKALAETSRELGYVFGVHDQYLDYYYSAKSFNFDNAIMNADGSHPYWDLWSGGPQSFLCPSVAPEYVRRNYNEFERLGIEIEGAYLDEFSVLRPDECFSPEHPMSRYDSVKKRCECFDILTQRGIVPSSEEPVDCYLPSLIMCHHAPYYTAEFRGLQFGPPNHHVGIPIPLLNLVWHDCVITPWDSLTHNRGVFGIPEGDWGFLNAILNGGTTYISIEEDEKGLELCNIVTKLHEKVACLEMVSHEFIENNWRHQRTTFADGTNVEVNYDTGDWTINYSK